ncbi:MAG: hypothetical protein MUF15_25795, partial [Acidobacteria bacterium]|nr:hypothetical protein [Acidobacteriota bacterium]
MLKFSGAKIWNSIKTTLYSPKDIIDQWTTGLSHQTPDKLKSREKVILDFIDKLYNLGLISFAEEDHGNFNHASGTLLPDSPQEFSMDDILEIGYEQNIPITVDLNITDKCNLVCTHCYAPIVDQETGTPKPKPADTAKKPFSLEGKCILVVGAGTGIGKGVALELARQGADVAISYSGSVQG